VWGRVFKYDIRLSLILIAFIPVQILIAAVFGRINYRLSKQDADVNARLTGKLAELVTHIPLAKAFVREDQELAKGQQMTEQLYRINIKTSWASQFKDLSETMVSLIQSLIIVLVGVLLLRNQDISTRSWIAFFLFSSVFGDAVSNFMLYWNNLKIIQGGASGVVDIMNGEEENYNGDICVNLTGDIECSHVHFQYEDNRPVLDDVNCVFQDNSVTALLGVSGCGKTTLINLIMRLYQTNAGDIKIGGKSIYDFGLESYRQQFVMVSQNSMLFSGTIRENVCYGHEDISEEMLVTALKKAGAYDFVMNMEHGVDTRLEEYGQNLSGGQRQRLAVARALLSDAHYLILDEPTASMDAIATAELYDMLKDITTDRCTIIIAHSPAVLSLAQNVVIIENGTIPAQGNVEQIMETNEFLAGFAGKKVTG
jgi:ATP-binding cassette subfamily B protein AbcA/BmrA